MHGRSSQTGGACLAFLCLILAGCAGGPQPVAGTPEEFVVPKSKVEAGLNVGRIQERQGGLVKALELYESLLRSDPDNPEVCHRLMVVHSRLGQAEQADAFFQKADRLKPNNADLYADYGYACYLQGDLTKSEAWLRKANSLRPKDKRITNNLALVLGTEGAGRKA